MKYILFIPLMFLHACAGFQGVADDVEKIADNDAVTIKADKDAFKDNTNLHIELDVVNHEAPQKQ